MRRVYQRALPTAVALLTLSACRDEPPTSPAAGARDRLSRAPASLHLESRSYDLVAHDAGRLLADEHGPDGVHAVEIRIEDSALRRLIPAADLESRVIAVAGRAGRLLLETATANAAPQLVLLEPDGRRTPLPQPGTGRERYLRSVDGGGGQFLTVRAPAAGGQELDLIDADRRLRRAIYRAPPGFEIAAIDHTLRFVALARRLHPESDEIVLHDRESGESRLRLPTGGDGRFRPLGFANDGGRLLVLADDGADRPRLEWLAVDSGRRTVVSGLRCPPEAARSLAGIGTVVTISCRGRRQTVRLDEHGAPLPLPAVPSGTRIVEVAGDAGRLAAIAWAGPGSPSDLATVDGHGLPEPLTYGLAPRLRPVRPAATGFLEVPVAADAARLPCELDEPPATWAGIVWFEDDSETPRWGEYRPLFAALAGRGIAVLRCRGRGAEGFGRTLRGAAGNDPELTARVDFERTLSALRSRLPTNTPVGLVGAGRWAPPALAFPGEIAVTVALFPTPAALAEEIEPAPPASPPAVRHGPLLLVLESAPPNALDGATARPRQAPSGARLHPLRGRRSALSGEPSAELAADLLHALEAALRSAVRPPSSRR